jgi:hypothetical protein
MARRGRSDAFGASCVTWSVTSRGLVLHKPALLVSMDSVASSGYVVRTRSVTLKPVITFRPPARKRCFWEAQLLRNRHFERKQYYNQWSVRGTTFEEPPFWEGNIIANGVFRFIRCGIPMADNNTNVFIQLAVMSYLPPRNRFAKCYTAVMCTIRRIPRQAANNCHWARRRTWCNQSVDPMAVPQSVSLQKWRIPLIV